MFQDDEGLRPEDWIEAWRGVLQEKYWCRFASANCFVHFGYDFYMYVGVPIACDNAIELARRAGLFAEVFQSPYHRKREEEL